MLIVITGSEQSGKSRLAEKITANLTSDNRFYIATMQEIDAECTKKIEKHRNQRKNLNFITLEIPYNLGQYKNKFQKNDIALLECMSNLLANEQFENNTPDPYDKITGDIKEIYADLKHLVIVTNNVFEGGLNYSGECLEYMKNLAKINNKLAESADIFIESTVGIPLIYKGESLYNEIFDRKF